MAKRIYQESVKKWAIRVGVPSGVAGFALLFYYLVFIQAITITGFSGDTVCQGTLENPCIAIVNFTVNEDVFIYPNNYDPWNRSILFDTDKQLKDWKVYRSWGSGWREIKLDRSCTGTWCGASDNKGTQKYSIAFREGRNYTIKLEAYKNDPTEKIKWGFGVEELGIDEYVDPYFFGTIEKFDNLGVDGIEIINFSINEEIINTADYNSLDYDFKSDFIPKNNRGFTSIKQDIFLKNNLGESKTFNVSIIVEINYSTVRWNGTKYNLTSDPIKFSTVMKPRIGEVTPNIFVDNYLNKRINYQDISKKGGYVLAYSKKNKNYLELKIDNLEVNSKENYYLDPEFTNRSDGFDITFAGATGITKNSSNFFIMTTNGLIYYYNSSGDYQGLYLDLPCCNNNVLGLVKNSTEPSSWWTSNNVNDRTYKYDEDGTELFFNSTTPYGSDRPWDMTTNDSDFWLVDDTDNYVYHIRDGADLGGGFSPTATGAANVLGIHTNGTDIWMSDVDDAFMYHTDMDGNNLTGGFDLTGLSYPVSMVGTSKGPVTDIWVTDATDEFVYHYSTSEVDETLPVVSIVYPNNNTNTSDNLIDINYTAVDTNLESCWYSNDTMLANTSITCGVNITTLTWAEGQHNVTIWANDSSSNEGRNTITFTVDTIDPAIEIVYPTNNSLIADTGMDVNYTISDANLEVCWYSNDTMSKNTSITCGTNITTISWSLGQHNVTIWGNDTASNENHTSVSFTIISTIPVVTLNFPIDNNFTNLTTILFNGTAVDNDNLDNVTIYGNWSGGWHANETNSSGINNTDYLFTINLTEGIYFWNYLACDLLNNCAFAAANRTITIDTTVPIPLFVSPTESDNAILGQTYVEINVSVTENNLDTIIVNLYNSTNDTIKTNTSTSTPYYINYTGLSTGAYYYNVTVNDSANNLNFTETRRIDLLNLTDFNVTLNQNITFEFRPTNATSKGVNVTNQTGSHSAFIIHNNLSNEISIWVKLNETHGNITLKMGNSSNYSLATSITDVYKILYTNLSMTEVQYLWAWADYDYAIQTWAPRLDIVGIYISFLNLLEGIRW